VSNQEYSRPHAAELLRRLAERRRFIQVVTGARQVGKTTLVTQVVGRAGLPHVFASADEPTLRGPEWIDAQWEAARLLVRNGEQRGALLVLDEVQKVPRWSEAVKRLWDADTRARRPLKVVLLGSAPLLLQRGLTESLAGRFEVVHLPHWTLAEMQEAFGWSVDKYLFYGGYPALRRSSTSRTAGRATSATHSSRRLSREMCCSSHASISQPSSGDSLSWGVLTRARSSRTRRCWASCRTRGTPRRLPTIWSCWRALAC